MIAAKHAFEDFHTRLAYTEKGLRRGCKGRIVVLGTENVVISGYEHIIGNTEAFFLQRADDSDGRVVIDADDGIRDGGYRNISGLPRSPSPSPRGCS